MPTSLALALLERTDEEVISRYRSSGADMRIFIALRSELDR